MPIDATVLVGPCTKHVELLLSSSQNVYMHTTKQDFVYPDNVAFPFGGEGQRQYLVIELHYDNPKMVSGKS